ncbi:MAG: tyrosine-type recombinase/integrase [Deltaproteobacteria bacterium]
MPTIDLSKRPSIAKIKHPNTGTDWYSHDGKGYKGLRLSVGKATKTWVLSKRVGSSIRSIRLGEFPTIATGDMALTVAQKKMDELDLGRDAKASGIKTLGDAFDSHIKNSTAKAATLETYRIEIDTYLTDLFAKPVERVSLPMMEEVVRNIERTGKVSTAEHVCALIRMASRRASILRGLPYVADELKVKQKPKKKPGILFDAKEQWPALGLIEGIKSPTRRVAWLLMLFTGLRAINVRELDWKDVDLDKATIRIADLKNHQQRIFPIATAAVDALKSLPHRDGWVFPAESKSGHIEDLGHLSTSEVVDDEKQLTKTLRQHDCRRLHTTAARAEKLPTYIIDQLRGDTEKTVQDVYDQGSASHDDANRIAAHIIRRCGILP